MQKVKWALDLRKEEKGAPKMEKFKQYFSFADVFRYPDAQYQAGVANCQSMLDENYPESADEFRRFSDFLAKSDPDAAEEIFTKTFHIQAICYLDLGYVIFGEDYKRGEFLVHMKDEQLKVGNDVGSELPDNLSKVLELMALSKDEKFVEELAVRVLIPALTRMISEFEEARMQLKEKVLKKLHKALIQQGLKGGNIYRAALSALKKVLEKDFAGIRYETAAPNPLIGGAFLKNCGDGCATDPLNAPVSQDLSVGML